MSQSDLTWIGISYSAVVSHNLNHQDITLCIAVTVNSISLMHCNDVSRVIINCTYISYDQHS